MNPTGLSRFKLEELLGSGSDYEVRSATDTETGRPVVVKRPNPDYIVRQMHHGIERLSQALIQVHQSVGDSVERLAHMVGYAEPERHDGYFGDTITDPYTVLIEERAKGVPLACDIRDKFKGVPIGLPQNLFTIHPLAAHATAGRFPVQDQLIELERPFDAAGLLVLDLRPQNVYFDPSDGKITVIDIGVIPSLGEASQGKISFGSRPRDFHDFFLEIFQYYASPDSPPSAVRGYGEPEGMRGVPDFDKQLQLLIDSYMPSAPNVRESAMTTLEKVRERAYGSYDEFQKDLNAYLGEVEARNASDSELEALTAVWREALDGLSDEYWSKFLLDRDSMFSAYR